LISSFQVIQSASLKFQVGGRAVDIVGSDLTLIWIGIWSLLEVGAGRYFGCQGQMW
jgi:hypothetical protein